MSLSAFATVHKRRLVRGYDRSRRDSSSSGGGGSKEPQVALGQGQEANTKYSLDKTVRRGTKGWRRVRDLPRRDRHWDYSGRQIRPCAKRCSIHRLWGLYRGKKFAESTFSFFFFWICFVKRKTPVPTQAIKEHKFVDPLVNPGDADLSCDVDFTSLRHPDLALHGPITQSKFLGNMGLFERCQHLLSNAKSQEQADALTAAYYRLAGEEIGQMGVVYKAMAVTSKDISAPPPFC